MLLHVPTSSTKPKQFNFIMDKQEHKWLLELAKAEGRSASGWLRTAIRNAKKREKTNGR
jgi:hypothetical protein